MGRLQTSRILVTATVQRQTAGLFVAEDLGARELKGVSELMTLYRIVRASGGGRRGGARALTPLVGREEELDLLSRRWERARSGEGQLVSDAVRQTRSATPELPFHLPDLGDDFGIGQRRDIAGVFVVRDGREDTAHDLAGTRLRHVRHDHDMAGASNRSNLADHRVLYTLAELVACPQPGFQRHIE